jgi:hypothetical protein
MDRCRTVGRTSLAVLALCAGVALAAPPDRLPDPPEESPNTSPLDRPVESPPIPPPPPTEEPLLYRVPTTVPLGYTGPSSILPREPQRTGDMVPVEDRWRIGFPEWDRYGRGHAIDEDSPYTEGHWWDPFNQNVLKGDYPLIGQHTFLDITATNFTELQARQLPTGTTPFESTQRPGSEEFFGRPDERNVEQYFRLSFDLFHGDAGFKPVDWRIKLTPVFNFNYLSVDELAVVNPDVRKGTTRARTFFSLEEYFCEVKLADLSPDYDFVSLRVGSQPFTSDFRGFLFSDTNRAIRLFGTEFANRDQFNILYFYQAEKDTNSELNTFADRRQQIVILNYFRQDFIFPGYTAEWSVHYDHDEPSFHYDKNDFLVRPDPVGVFTPHDVNVAYLGFAGDGHINRLNISNAFFWALGRDSLNPLANAPQNISAEMAAVELSYDRDWARFRASFFWASGDSNINNSHATGFDSILDDPNFAGGKFSFWQSQAIKLLGTNLKNENSLVPDLRASKLEGQANFVNPGVFLANVGVDLDLTPKLRWINNANLLWFDETQVLEQFLFQTPIHHFIGVDLSSGVEYRPLLSNNIIIQTGLSTLIPGKGFEDIYDPLNHTVGPIIAGFLDITLTY